VNYTVVVLDYFESLNLYS